MICLNDIYWRKIYSNRFFGSVKSDGDLQPTNKIYIKKKRNAADQKIYKKKHMNADSLARRLGLHIL